MHLELSPFQEIDVQIDERQQVKVDSDLVGAAAQYVVNDLQKHFDTQCFVCGVSMCFDHIAVISAATVRVRLDARLFRSEFVASLRQIARELTDKVEADYDSSLVYVVESAVNDIQDNGENMFRDFAYVSVRIRKKQKG